MRPGEGVALRRKVNASGKRSNRGEVPMAPLDLGEEVVMGIGIRKA